MREVLHDYLLSDPGHFASQTFGRDAANFERFVTWLAIVSIILWTAVLLSILIRSGAYYVIYRRRVHDAKVRNDTGGR